MKKETRYLTTMEFLRTTRARCGYKLVGKYSENKKAVKYSLVTAQDEIPCEEISFTDHDGPKDKEMLKAQVALNNAELAENDEMDNKERRYREYLKLYYIYLNTPINKRKNREAELMKLFYVVRKDSFDPSNMTIEFVLAGKESSCGRLGLLNREYSGEEEYFDYYDGFEGDACIIPQIEIPFLPFKKDELLFFEVFNKKDFEYFHETYCDNL